MRSIADSDAAGGIHRGDGADCDAFRRDRGGRAEAAFHVHGGRAQSRTDTSERKILRRTCRRRIAEIAIGRETSPGLVAATQEIEQDRAGHDRHPRGADRKAAALLGEQGLHAGGRVEAEGRSARERDGVDMLDRHRRIEQVDLARARAAAAQIHRRDGGRIEHDCGHAGAELAVLGMADTEARDIGDQIAHS